MSYRPTAVSQVVLIENFKGIPLNIEENRRRMSVAFLSDGDPFMTPAMCGFLLTAFALDKSTEAYGQSRRVAHRLRATYEGMEMHHAIAVAMRVKVEDPELFRNALTR